MSDPFVGEIRVFGFNFAPRNWAYCNGQTLSIAQNTALFSILGIVYGGNGQSTFGLPNFNNAAPVHVGQSPGNSNYTLGQLSGTPSVTLTTQQIPTHIHTLFGGTLATPDANQNVATPASNAIFGLSGPNQLYDATGPGTPSASFAPQALAASTGTGQAHENRQPILALNFCICLYGAFPTRN